MLANHLMPFKNSEATRDIDSETQMERNRKRLDRKGKERKEKKKKKGREGNLLRYGGLKRQP